MEPLTPAAVEAMSAAEDACSTSSEMRKEAWSTVDHSGRVQQAVHRAVNQGLTQKLAQTVTLAVSTFSYNVYPKQSTHYNNYHYITLVTVIII